MRRHNAKNEIIALEASNMHKKYISKKKIKMFCTIWQSWCNDDFPYFMY